MKTRFLNKILMALCASLPGLMSAQISDNSWTGATSASWNLAANWSQGSIPASESNVIYGAGSTNNAAQTLDASFNINGINSQSSSALSLANGSGGSYILGINSAGITLAGSGSLDISADIALLGGQVWTSSNDNIMSFGNINMLANTLQIGAVGNVNFNGVISGTSALVFNDSSTGGLITVNALNTYSGGTIINSGNILLGAGGSLGSGSSLVGFNNSNPQVTRSVDVPIGTGAITLNGGVLDVNARTLSNTIRLNGGTITGGNLLDRTINIRGEASSSINGGYNGFAAGTDPARTFSTTGLEVNILGGTAVFDGGLVTVHDTMEVGEPIGALSFNSGLQLKDTTNTYFDLDGLTAGSFDQLKVGSGTLTLDGTLWIRPSGSFTSNTYQAGDSWKILDVAAGVNIVDNGYALRFDFATLSPGLSWDSSTLLTDGTIRILPEPGSVALLGMGALLLGFHRRRNS